MPRTSTKSASKVAPAAASSATENSHDHWEFEQFVQPPRVQSRRPWLLVSILLIIIVVLAGLVFYTFQLRSVPAPLSYQAIYLDNGQIYYAKVVKEDELNLFLDDVFYVDTQQQTLPAAKEGEEPQSITVPVLVRRADAAYKPEGYLQINRQKVVAREALGSDSQILQEIEKLKQK